MTAIVTRLTRRGRARAAEATLQARAYAEARKTVLALHEGRCVAQRLRLSIALFDAVAEALADLEGPDVTGPRCAAKAGQLYPYTPNIRDERFARADARLAPYDPAVRAALARLERWGTA